MRRAGAWVRDPAAFAYLALKTAGGEKGIVGSDGLAHVERAVGCVKLTNGLVAEPPTGAG